MTPPASDSPSPAPAPQRVALLGNPNTGKTSLFNGLCGVRAATANFPGSTADIRRGRCKRGRAPFELIDLPGHYGLHLDRPESKVCREFLSGAIKDESVPDAIIVVADATNLARNLMIVSQALQQGRPAIVALNMTDLAQRRGLSIDHDKLSARLGVPVVPTCARTGAGVEDLVAALDRATTPDVDLPDPSRAEDAAEWAATVFEESVGGPDAIGDDRDTVTDRLDKAFTHPALGLAIFVAVMVGVFYTIFTLAAVPMDLIEALFEWIGSVAGNVLPEGAIHDLVVDGIVAGVAGTVVFLPQICLLFFLITLIEESGYLARAAFVVDRILRRFGLPGQAFVPLLSAHACAIPAIMSARLVPDHRDRLATVLVAPFMSCAARLPVYVLLIGILFSDSPLLAGFAFAGCYVLGALAAVLTSLLLRRTVLRGPSLPMVLELPSYRRPSLKVALLTTWDRASVFLRKAGTVILGICIVLWWLGAYPHVEPPAEVVSMRATAAEVETIDPDRATALRDEADHLEARHANAESYIGRIGQSVQPIFEPLGYDWQLTIGVMTSFAAREVFVTTMAVVLTGADDDPGENEDLRTEIVTATRDDGTPIFTRATTASLLVFYVLAMQCLPTLAVTRRETGGWRWAALQFVWMSALAWLAAFATYRIVLAVA